MRRAADAVLAEHARLDLLVNNAGVMGTPYRLRPRRGSSCRWRRTTSATSRSTGLLLDRIVTTERSRIVTVSRTCTAWDASGPTTSPASRRATPGSAYGTSKLANLLFSAELSRRLHAAGLATSSVAAHPGWTRSNLAGSGAALGTSRLRRRLGRAAGTTLGQSAAAGALPVLCAATSSNSRRGSTSGRRASSAWPGRPGWPGPPAGPATSRPAAALWRASEELTGVRFSVGAPVLRLGPVGGPGS